MFPFDIEIFNEQKEQKQKRVTTCTKCGKKMQIPEEHYKEEQIKTLNFVCSDCTNNEIVETEIQLEKEIISKSDINPDKKYSTPEAAKRLGLCIGTVHKEIRRGKIKAGRGKGKIKPRYRISGKELIKYAKNCHKRQIGAHKTPRKRFSAPTRSCIPLILEYKDEYPV